MEVRIRLPRVPAGLFANLLGLAGLIAFAVCVGGILASIGFAGAWWVAGLVGACQAVALSYIASTHTEPEATEALTGPTRKLATVKPAAARSA